METLRLKISVAPMTWPGLRALSRMPFDCDLPAGVAHLGRAIDYREASAPDLLLNFVGIRQDPARFEFSCYALTGRHRILTAGPQVQANW